MLRSQIPNIAKYHICQMDAKIMYIHIYICYTGNPAGLYVPAQVANQALGSMWRLVPTGLDEWKSSGASAVFTVGKLFRQCHVASKAHGAQRRHVCASYSPSQINRDRSGGPFSTLVFCALLDECMLLQVHITVFFHQEPHHRPGESSRLSCSPPRTAAQTHKNMS